MKLPLNLFLQNIKKGSVLRDSKFVFPDGDCKPKWIVILSDNIIEDSYVYCLTTSQKKTYKNSFSDYLLSNDPVFEGNEIIIEIERINLISIKSLKEKHNDGILKCKGKLSKDTLEKILNKIDDSIRIEDYIKEWIL